MEQQLTEKTMLYIFQPRLSYTMIKVTKKPHIGDLILQRTSHTYIKKYAPPLAVWTCCRERIDHWEEAWETRDRKIPLNILECEKNESNRKGIRLDTTGEVALAAQPISQRKTAPKKSKGSSNKSSHNQSEVIEDSVIMDPKEIKLTQKTVKKFWDESHPTIMEAMHLIFDGTLDVGEYPRIRVATRGNMENPGCCFYTCDNRRLFLFKVLLLKEIEVQWVEWSEEFEGKLKQGKVDENHVDADDEGVKAFRKAFIHQCFENSVVNEEDCKLYIPGECAGYLIGSKGQTIRRQRARFVTEISVSNLSQTHFGRSLGSSIVQVAYSEKSNSRRKYVAGKAKKEHVRMVRKLLR
uniref:K Homology domain-containing protein n=1 Tax=Clytia hemisphaerica TaxID=252671 RepID=A0A7M5WZN4_9CNID